MAPFKPGDRVKITSGHSGKWLGRTGLLLERAGDTFGRDMFWVMYDRTDWDRQAKYVTGSLHLSPLPPDTPFRKDFDAYIASELGSS